MAQLRDALEQILDIRQQLSRSVVCTGIRSRTTLLTAGVAIATAIAQQVLIDNPMRAIDKFVMLWSSAALVSLVIVGIGLYSRMRLMPTALERDTSFQTVEQMFPAIVAGLFLTACITTTAVSSAWLLPGLWMILLSLGIFAARRAWPKPVGRVGFFYFLAGIYALMGGPERALHPWMMGSVFAAGQVLASFMLYWWLERGE